MSWNSPKYITPFMSSTVELDPLAPGTAVRRAFALEALLNLFTLPLIFYPKATLSPLVNDPSAITPTAELLARLFGGLVVGALTPALLLGLPNTRQAIESRRTVYVLLGCGEAALIPVLLWHALEGWERGSLTFGACWASIGCLIPPLAWRLYVLSKPEMFGRYREVNKAE